jgi:hypothetical protein
LRTVTIEGQPVLAAVQGYGRRDRKSAMAALERERMPAAYVSVIERSGGDKDYRRPGRTRLSVLLAERSERAAADARIGGVDCVGIYAVSELAAVALQDMEVGTGLRLLLLDDQAVGGVDGFLIREQRYEVHRIGQRATPTFGEMALAGAESEVSVELGKLQRATSVFSFPGVDGVFERHMGTRGRSIIWQGQLRAEDDTAMNALEAGIEAEIERGQSKEMTDTFGRHYAACTLRSFERTGARKADELNGQVLQDFSLQFEQLA